MKRVNFKVSLQCVIFNKKNEILLIERCNTNYCDGMYSLPGGHLEENESIIQGMMRELLEELNLKFDENELKLFKIINRNINDDNYIDFIFEANLKDRIPINLEKEKCSKFIYKEKSKLPKNIIAIIKEIFKSDDLYLKMEEKND